MEDVVIIGAGITGLTTSYWLKKEGLKIKIVEAEAETGGNIKTVKHNEFIFDTGPNSGLETTPLISQLVDELDLKKEFVYANEESNKRYILRNNVLYQLPLNIREFLTTKLFTVKGKFRIMLEPFIGRSKDGDYQSLAEFVTRRLGHEFLDYAINPFVSGVFAGEPENLSVKAAFPKLYRLEEVYGGIFKGMILGSRERKRRKEKSKQNAKMFSFRNGMSVLTDKLGNILYDDILLNHELIDIEKIECGYRLILSNNNGKIFLETRSVFLTIPAYVAANILVKYDAELARHLSSIYYPPILVLNIIFEKKKIGQSIDGFGFLIPAKENKSFLGAIWNGSIFPNRGNDTYTTFTIFVGGSRNADIFKHDLDNIVTKVLEEFKDIMKIHNEPTSIQYRYWDHSIPQYSIGYIEKEKAINKFEHKNQGIFLGGNYRGGISLGDCIKNSKIHHERIQNFIKNNQFIEYHQEIN